MTKAVYMKCYILWNKKNYVSKIKNMNMTREEPKGEMDTLYSGALDERVQEKKNWSVE